MKAIASVRNGLYTAALIILLWHVAGSGQQPLVVSQVPVQENMVMADTAGPQPTGLPDPAALSDLIIYAQQHHPLVGKMYFELKAALAKAPQARALPDPTVSYRSEIRMDPRWQTVEIGQMFPWPGRLAAANQEALAEAAAIRQMYEAARQEVRYQVAYRYFEYGYLQEALRSISQNIELMASWTEIIRSRYVTSQTTQPDLLKTEVELALLRNDSLQLTNTLKNSQVQLNEALNRPLDARLPAIREETTQKLTIGQATLEQLVRAGNPEVLAGREKIIAAEARTAAMRREAYPDIMLAASYGWPAGNAGAMDRSTMVMGSVFLPLWWGKKKAGSTEAEALRQAQEKETQETANRMAARAFQMYYEYQNAEQQTMLYESDLLPKAEQSLKIIAAQYLTGATDILMLVDMERTVFDLKLKKAGAFKAAQQARAELEMLAGQELP